MMDFVKLKTKGLADVELVIKDRHVDDENRRRDGATPLNSGLLSDYDELWIFGARQANTNSEPLNELTLAEENDLKEWMKIGGVLITGDHAEPLEGLSCSSNHQDFVNLGAAIGRKVPRAGQLRVWDGPPTGCYEGPLASRDNFNTQEGDNPSLLDVTPLQHDSRPQSVRLSGSSPHRLFWWYIDPNKQQLEPILKFPDHMHEGKLTIPKTLDCDWPSGPSRPEVVAQGRDKRFPNEQRYYDLVVAYDGDTVGVVGRIVADSSFHHYINRNLLRIRDKEDNGEPKPLTDLDQIAQYYANLALWLAPKKKRDLMIARLFFWCAGHPDVLENKSNDATTVGRVAMDVLDLEIGFSNLYRLLAPSEHEKCSRDIESLFFLTLFEEVRLRTLGTSGELVLGSAIKEYREYFNKKGVTDFGGLQFNPAIADVALTGIIKAFPSPPEEIKTMLTQYRKALEKLRK